MRDKRVKEIWRRHLGKKLGRRNFGEKLWGETWGRNLGEKLGRNVREEIESAGKTTENAEESGTWGARHCGDHAGALLAYLPTNLTRSILSHTFLAS